MQGVERPLFLFKTVVMRKEFIYNILAVFTVLLTVITGLFTAIAVIDYMYGSSMLSPTTRIVSISGWIFSMFLVDRIINKKL